ncbi:unnamed protein product [Effrenium voratum]|uniref:Uncharacterized protein n=1 Tax=Effrenium voratum TaxID=2562239 RepID=A0AA36ILP5_9DINO|nr:unnamed protein product [Effrenium voratum]
MAGMAAVAAAAAMANLPHAALRAAAEETVASWDAEVRHIFRDMAGAAQNAAGSEPEEQLHAAGRLRQGALCVLEILQAPSCVDLDVRDMYGLDAARLLEAMAAELQAAQAAAGAAQILAARRALQAARRIEEFHYAQANVPSTLVAAAGRLRPFYITGEGSEAPESAQSNDFVAPTLESGTTLDAAATSSWLAGLPHLPQEPDKHVPQRAFWWLLERQCQQLEQQGDLPGAAALLEAARTALQPGHPDFDDRDVADILHELGMLLHALPNQNMVLAQR